MGKYAEAIGVWEHTIKGVTEDKDVKFRLKPTKADNLKLLDLKEEAEKKKSERVLLEGVQNVYFDTSNCWAAIR